MSLASIFRISPWAITSFVFFRLLLFLGIRVTFLRIPKSSLRIFSEIVIFHKSPDWYSIASRPFWGKSEESCLAEIVINPKVPRSLPLRIYLQYPIQRPV